MASSLTATPGVGFLPGLGEELVSQDAIGLSAFPQDTAPADRWRAHFRQHRFSEDAATHHPDAPGTAVLLDPGEEHAQRRAVRRVAGQHLVGQGRPPNTTRSSAIALAPGRDLLPLPPSPPRQPKPKTVQTLANPDHLILSALRLRSHLHGRDAAHGIKAV